MAQLWKNFTPWDQKTKWIDLANLDDPNRLSRVLLPDGPFDESIAAVRGQIVPATRRNLLKAIACVLAVTRPRDPKAFQAEAWKEVILDILSQYPAEGILDALAEWPHTSPFLPSPSEIIALAKPKEAARQRLINVLLASKYHHFETNRPIVYPDGTTYFKDGSVKHPDGTITPP